MYTYSKIIFNFQSIQHTHLPQPNQTKKTPLPTTIQKKQPTSPPQLITLILRRRLRPQRLYLLRSPQKTTPSIPIHRGLPLKPRIILTLVPVRTCQVLTNHQPTLSCWTIIPKQLQSAATKAEPLYQGLDLRRLVEISYWRLLGHYHVSVDIRVDEVWLVRFLVVASNPHQAVLFCLC